MLLQYAIENKKLCCTKAAKPNYQVIRFSRFCTATTCDRRTDRRTDTRWRQVPR